MPAKHKRLSKKVVLNFKKKIYAYFKNHGRALPWRETSDPYHILVSEIMLQQTQVDRVIDKYKQFIRAFPTVVSLSKASTNKVLTVWQGLGYNRRALMIHKCAQAIVNEFHSVIPDNQEELNTLPGIGKATAASICVFAFHRPDVFIETNIRTVYIHEFFPDSQAISDHELIPLIKQTLDIKQPYKFYSALMDYGAYLKKNFPNPSRKSAHHTRQSRFVGSDRQIRGNILRLLLTQKKLSFRKMNIELQADPERLKKILQGLIQEGFIRYINKFYIIHHS